MNKGVLHLIGNAHLDPVWLWRWPEGYEAARATFRSVLDLMSEDPEFVFTSSQAAVYEWIERGDPGLFAEIKERVREGRWRIAGGWWMQCDCNIPSGESLVRQGLYGQRYFLEKLGVMASAGYNVDSFGHNAMIPQILKKSGMDAYVFMRPDAKENPRVPRPLFRWESADGSSVLTYSIPESYCSWGEWMEEKLRRTASLLTQHTDVMEFYGVGNHGGGPTRDNLARIRRLREDRSLPELRFSAPDMYFASVTANAGDLPVWREELQHHASGCYAAHSEIKKNNRALEHLLESAEKFCVMANVLTGLGYPHDELTRAWKAVLFNQFHDILAGTSIREAYDDARDLHGMARQTASEALVFALGAIASQIDTTGEGVPIVVFNPSSWQRNDYCECELHGFGTRVRVKDDNGRVIPCQVIEPSAVVTPGGRTRICFPAQVDSIGYRLYRAFAEEAGEETGLSATKSSLENRLLRIDIDPGSGQLLRIVEKRTGREVLSDAVEARVITDPSDTWSHGVFSFHDVIGCFSEGELELIERGPVRATIRAKSRYNDSTLVQEYRLYDDRDWVEVDCRVDWHERQCVLKLAFPVNVTAPGATYEIQYGHVSRPADGEEEPGLRWVHVGDEEYGLCLVNDSKYSYDVLGNTLSLTVLRSPVYAHHVPRELDPHGDYEYIDQGVSRLRYRLVPHRGSWRDVLPHRLADELCMPLMAVVQSGHPGNRRSRHSFVSVDAPNVVVSAIKQSEEKDGIIVRCFETHGRPAKCRFQLSVPNVSWDADIGRYEIKTWLIRENEVVETDLLERPCEKQPYRTE